MDLKDLDNIKINFIIGPGRSGTSLLVLLLNHSPDCIAAPEVHHLLYFYKKYRNVQTVSQNLIDDYTKYLEFFRRKNNPLIGLPDNALLNALYAGQKINYSQLSKLIYLSLFGEKGVNGSVKIIIDKNPHYTFLLDKLFRIFPDARVLALIRDYRGYILSNIQSQKPSSIKRNVIYYANAWNLFANHIFKGEKNYPSKI
ncbi:MAG: Sulfotransferase domain protein, partial [Bacteroidota bacterium]|nr:Sulfotransferase domain protein [Bacteroidota bacterium]